MIERLTLLDFQKHEKLVVEFSPTLTVIVGDTDAGKSAFVRGMGFVCLNNLSGERFIRWDQLRAVAILRFDGGRKVVRSRGNGTNSYSIDGKKFKAFGSSVPPEIADALGISEVNFQWQLDQPFWFSETDGQVSRNLNQIVNLGSIDSALSKVATKVRAVRSEIHITEQWVESSEKQRTELAWVGEFNERLTRLESAQKVLAEKRDRIAAVARLVSDAKRLRATALLATERATEGEKLEEMFSRLEAKRLRVKRLRSLVEQLKRAEEVASRPVPDIGPLSALRKQADQQAERRRSLEELVGQLRRAKDRVCQTQEKLAESEAKLAAITKNKRCPVCGAKFESGMLNHSPSSSRTCTSATKHLPFVRKKTGMG